jgi:hypothetical protein
VLNLRDSILNEQINTTVSKLKKLNIVNTLAELIINKGTAMNQKKDRK